MQWVKNVRESSVSHPLEGSVVQRLQRFCTYGSLKQQVLRIITDELAANDNDITHKALEKVWPLSSPAAPPFVALCLQPWPEAALPWHTMHCGIRESGALALCCFGAVLRAR